MEPICSLGGEWRLWLITVEEATKIALFCHSVLALGASMTTGVVAAAALDPLIRTKRRLCSLK